MVSGAFPSFHQTGNLSFEHTRHKIEILINLCLDIIDGFGSYPDYFMRSPVFCGVGTVAFKYYMLFQHQSVIDEGPGDEPSWLLGAAPGPYIKEHSRSIFMFLGKHVAFLGLDCRTERMVRPESKRFVYNTVLNERSETRFSVKSPTILLLIDVDEKSSKAKRNI